jgi:hypothetical protein
LLTDATKILDLSPPPAHLEFGDAIEIIEMLSQ